MHGGGGSRRRRGLATQIYENNSARAVPMRDGNAFDSDGQEWSVRDRRGPAGADENRHPRGQVTKNVRRFLLQPAGVYRVVAATASRITAATSAGRDCCGTWLVGSVVVFAPIFFANA